MLILKAENLPGLPVVEAAPSLSTPFANAGDGVAILLMLRFLLTLLLLGVPADQSSRRTITPRPLGRATSMVSDVLYASMCCQIYIPVSLTISAKKCRYSSKAHIDLGLGQDGIFAQKLMFCTVSLRPSPRISRRLLTMERNLQHVGHWRDVVGERLIPTAVSRRRNCSAVLAVLMMPRLRREHTNQDPHLSHDPSYAPFLPSL